MSTTPANFEEAMERLEELVQRLEEGEIGLEESLAAYREGVSLHRFCQERLRKVEEELLTVLGEAGAGEAAGEDGRTDGDGPR
jgi:exodeoxyribonuclease VII small subunit